MIRHLNLQYISSQSAILIYIKRKQSKSKQYTATKNMLINIVRMIKNRAAVGDCCLLC